jgi:hypothetical protein
MDFDTFIIGAGSSAAYSLPTGTDLTRFFSSDYPELLRVNFTNQVGQFTNQETFDYYHHSLKIKELIDDGKMQSIDLIISRFPELSESAKLGISYKILLGERKVSFAFTEIDWITSLYNRATANLVSPSNLSNLDFHNLKIITFNYDRVFEKRIYDLLHFICSGVSEPRILELFSQIEIIHVYGKLGNLEFEHKNSFPQIPWQRDINLHELIEMTMPIKAMFQEKESTVRDRTTKILADSKNIFIIGFGYDENNLRNIGFDDGLGLSAKNLFCCMYGKSEYFKEEWKRKYSQFTHKGPSVRHNVLIDSHQCTEFAQTYFEKI